MSEVESLSPEQRCERVKMALAEAGYPDTSVRVIDDDGRISVDSCLPMDVVWRAHVVVQPRICWPCWSTNPFDPSIESCDHDPWTSPWPPAPSPMEQAETDSARREARNG